MINLLLMNTFLFFHYGNQILILLFSERAQILKAEYKYGQYCTPFIQSDCRYFFVLTIVKSMVVKARQSFQFFKQKTWFLGNNRGLP